MDRTPSPRPGDVIFVCFPKVESYLSCVIQRKMTVDNPRGPGFSHVAIALDEKVAFEASPTHGPDRSDETHEWSGVPHIVIGGRQNVKLDPHFQQLLDGTLSGGSPPAKETPDNSEEAHPRNQQSRLDDDPDADNVSKPRWNQGARLILLPDLLIPAKKTAVLRHPNADRVPASEFDLTSVHIARMYGSPYSIEKLRTSFEHLLPKLARLVPERACQLILTKAKAPPDDFAKLLMDNEEFKESIEKSLPGPSLTNAFFCSQLVVAMLLHAGLLQEQPQLSNITPCGLFDLLKGMGWVDVTESDYGNDAIEAWKGSNKVRWQTNYYFAVGRAIYFRMHHLTMAGLDAAQRRLDDFGGELGNIIGRLNH
jgi:hypothetical protein